MMSRRAFYADAAARSKHKYEAFSDAVSMVREAGVPVPEKLTAAVIREHGRWIAYAEKEKNEME